MKSSIEGLTKNLDTIRVSLSKLLREHSAIYPMNSPFESMPIISVNGDHAFRELGQEGKLLQSKLHADFTKINEVIRVLLSKSPKDRLDNLESASGTILRLISQNYGIWASEFSNPDQFFQDIVNTLNSVFPPGTGEVLIVPDTNALYSNIDLENWKFDDFQKFTFLITPNVLSEVDKHKNEHRNESVREKALKLTSRIKEYRRRGNILEGVVVKQNAISLQLRALEANYDNTLPWLDRSVPDDRLIAEYVEVLREFPSHIVILVTSDINLQSKCEFAGLKYNEPPAPVLSPS